jgi:hypothetical protein
MSKSIRAPFGTTITVALAATLVSGLAVLLSGVSGVKAELQAKAAAYQVHSRSDRLPILAKGAACSSLGWPNYEQGCLFDMRRPADEMRTVRIIVLR